jgi:hypothetical protein
LAAKMGGTGRTLGAWRVERGPHRKSSWHDMTMICDWQTKTPEDKIGSDSSIGADPSQT